MLSTTQLTESLQFQERACYAGLVKWWWVMDQPHALEVSQCNVLYKFTFYLLTYLQRALTYDPLDPSKK